MPHFGTPQGADTATDRQLAESSLSAPVLAPASGPGGPARGSKTSCRDCRSARSSQLIKPGLPWRSLGQWQASPVVQPRPR
jgi:hypothetical protein